MEIPTTFKWQIRKKMIDYFERNHKLSPLNELEYIFLKELYWYLTKQVLTQELKNSLYKNYCKLIDLCYFPNLEEINTKMVNTIYIQCSILLEREHSSPWTFIQLNKESHYQKMKNTLELIYNWALNEKKGHIMEEKEFWETMEFIRKEFNKDTIDLNYQIGKWPKKLRKRFNRESIRKWRK